LVKSKLPITLACGDYEIVRPLKEGLVEPEGIELTLLTGQDPTTRHWRFLRNRELEVSELSGSSYIVARGQGMHFQALPIFLHRRFRHGFVYINTGKGIAKPSDLNGRKVGVKSFAVTAVHWLRGILQHEYGVDLKSIHWFTELDEDIDYPPPAGFQITQLAHDQSLDAMLCDGTLDALLHPNVIKPLLQKDPRIGRLFPDYRQEEIRYYRKTGIFPIMHVMGIKPELAERHPWVPGALYRAFDEAKRIAMQRMADADLVPLAFYDDHWDEQAEIFGPDPWEYGLGARNRNNIETLMGYSVEQGLIGQAIPLQELFLPVE
jgi:4,5-dihydroxyphthalate decarboxylase